MRKLRRVNPNVSGFTLIEILMAVLLIAILATIAITQFTNFSKESKNAAVKESLGILRHGIQKQFGQMRIRCNLTNNALDAYPDLGQLMNNDITYNHATYGQLCTTNDIPQASDRYFVAGGIPQNPWSDKACTDADRRTVWEANAASNAELNAGTMVANGNLDTSGNGTSHCGWIYNSSTGRIKANSNNNAGYPNGDHESSY